MSLLQIKNLCFSYPDGREALKDLNFSITGSEKVALVGLNGAGKSTLLLSIAGVYKAAGSVEIEGIPMNKANRKIMGQKVGLVFQDPNDQLFMPTVYEDIAFGPQNMGLPKADIDKRVKNSLSAVGLGGFEGRLTHHLSFGEKKRAALATILSLEPLVLLLDEPTSNLDPKRRREFMSIIKSMPQAMIIATHDLAMARNVCTRVIALKEGRIIDDGDISLLSNKVFLDMMELDD